MEVLDIRPSNQKFKKYSADVIINDKLYRNINSGDVRYEHYRDSTPLRLYSHLDHNDIKRKNAFYRRHARNKGPAAMLAKEFLW